MRVQEILLFFLYKNVRACCRRISEAGSLFLVKKRHFSSDTFNFSFRQKIQLSDMLVVFLFFVYCHDIFPLLKKKGKGLIKIEAVVNCLF